MRFMYCGSLCGWSKIITCHVVMVVELGVTNGIQIPRLVLFEKHLHSSISSCLLVRNASDGGSAPMRYI